MLPHADHAVVDRAKISDDLLSSAHPVGPKNWLIADHSSQPRLVTAVPEYVMVALHQTVALTRGFLRLVFSLAMLGLSLPFTILKLMRLSL